MPKVITARSDFNKFDACAILQDELSSAASTFGATSRTAAWKDIGERCNISPSTIDKLVTNNDPTRYPRWQTIWVLLTYFGYEVKIIAPSMRSRLRLVKS
jgi:hypothetical protein